MLRNILWPLLLILSTTFMLDSYATAQTIKQVGGVPENETKAERKAREKRLQVLADSISFIEAKTAIDENYFVITANRIAFGTTGRVDVAPDASTNFVLVQGSKAIIQLASPTRAAGPNGLGGFTAEGQVSGKKLKVDKKGNIKYDFNVIGPGISAQVSISVTSKSNSATAYITSNVDSYRLTIYGPLTPYKHN